MSHSHTDHHNHSHAHNRKDSGAKLQLVMMLTLAYMLVEVGAAYYTGSLALLADAGHMLSDVGSILLSLLAIWFTAKPANAKRTYGYYRSEILASFVNGLILVGLSVFIIYESIRRFNNPPAVMSSTMLIVSLVGFALNLYSVRILHAGAKESLNVKSAYLEVFSDLLATIGLVVASIIMMFTKWYLADPLISVIIGLMILPRTWMLLSECVNVLMEGTPGHVDLSKLRESFLAVAGVVEVHDIHVWTITSGLDAMSGHVTISDDAQADAVLSELTKIAEDEFHLNHTTIQVEQVQCKRLSGDSCSI